jgi:hypothetical protein
MKAMNIHRSQVSGKRRSKWLPATAPATAPGATSAAAAMLTSP